VYTERKFCIITKIVKKNILNSDVFMLLQMIIFQLFLYLKLYIIPTEEDSVNHLVLMQNIICLYAKRLTGLLKIQF